jgi:hypothetical protein
MAGPSSPALLEINEEQDIKIPAAKGYFKAATDIITEKVSRKRKDIPSVTLIPFQSNLGIICICLYICIHMDTYMYMYTSICH